MRRVLSLKGHATLENSQGDSITSYGSVTQTNDGRIICTLAPGSREDVFKKGFSEPNLNEGRFTLRTDNGRTITSNTWKSTNVSVSTSSEGQIQCQISGMMSRLEIQPDQASERGTPYCYRFFLTNLDFLGTSVTTYRKSGGIQEHRDTIYINELGYRIRLRLLSNASSIIKQLRADRGIQATCEMSITAPEDVEPTAIVEAADDICTLLSLASGNGVTWNVLRTYDRSRRWVGSTHRDGITRPFSAQSLINPTNGKGLSQLLQSGLHSLRKWDRAIKSNNDDRPLRNAMSLYQDVHPGGRYLQSRTLTAIIVIELLASKYAAQQGIEFILPNNKFKRIQKTLRACLNGLSSEFPDLQSEIHRMTKNLAVLNRPTFREKINWLMAGAGVPIDGESVGTFIKVRDSIIHAGDYDHSLSLSPVQQHAHVIEFVDRLFLGLLAYEGNYVRRWSDYKEVAFP